MVAEIGKAQQLAIPERRTIRPGSLPAVRVQLGEGALQDFGVERLQGLQQGRRELVLDGGGKQTLGGENEILSIGGANPGADYGASLRLRWTLR